MMMIASASERTSRGPHLRSPDSCGAGWPAGGCGSSWGRGSLVGSAMVGVMVLESGEQGVCRGVGASKDIKDCKDCKDKHERGEEPRSSVIFPCSPCSPLCLCSRLPPPLDPLH